MPKVIEIARDEHVARVMIDREERRNALSRQVVRELERAIRELGEDSTLRVIVLTGAGERAFCSGGDLRDQGSGAGGLLELHEGRGEFAELLLTMNRCPKPIVARVNGLALGGGFGLVLSCDLAVAAEHASFGTPEIKVGLFPMMISAVIQRNLQRKHAMELMLTGRRVDAHRALEMGVVNQVAPAGELDEVVDELVEAVASSSPAVLGLGRRAFYDTQDMGFEEALRALHSQLTINTLAEDAAEGVGAFLAKREPRWKGR